MFVATIYTYKDNKYLWVNNFMANVKAKDL